MMTMALQEHRSGVSPSFEQSWWSHRALTSPVCCAMTPLRRPPLHRQWARTDHAAPAGAAPAEPPDDQGGSGRSGRFRSGAPCHGGHRACRAPVAQPVIATIPHLESGAGYLPRFSLAFPRSGRVDHPALGYAEQSGPELPVPVASLAKMATAVVVFRDHPMPMGSSGPSILITGDEASQFGVDLANDETTIPLQAGESITELQLLQALMVASANDAAYTLAEWDAGSQAAFVAKMNGLAAWSGPSTPTSSIERLRPQSVSTAADILRIAATGMAIPAFAWVVASPAATVPWPESSPTSWRSSAPMGSSASSPATPARPPAAWCSPPDARRWALGSSCWPPSSGQKLQPPPAAATHRLRPAHPPRRRCPTTRWRPNTRCSTPDPFAEELLYVSESGVTPVVLTRTGEVMGTATAEWATVPAGHFRRSPPRRRCCSAYLASGSRRS